MQTDAPPPLSERDTVVRADSEWLAMAAEYRKTEAVAAEWAAKLEAARRALKAAGSSPRAYARQGAVDYKAIVQERLPDVDVAPYRRPGGEQVRVTVERAR